MPIDVDIKKAFGGFTLNVCFKAENETLALLGASGCGKSLTLKCIAGIETPDEGHIILNGRTLFDSEEKINLSPQKRNTGMLFQNYALIPTMTVEENISLGIKKPKRERIPIIEKMMKMFMIDDLRRHYPSQLSGGQQQRTALARMFAAEPEILMLDEPFSALDGYLRWQLEQELYDVLDMFKQKGTILYVSHNRNEVYRICDRIAVVSDGRIDAVSEKDGLFANPETCSAALLTGCKNISAAVKSDETTVFAKDWGIRIRLSEPVPDDINYVGLRAHYIRFTADPAERNSYRYKVVKEIEEPFESIMIISIKSDNSAGGLIRVAMPKKERIHMNSLPKYVCIEERDVMLLK